MQRVVVTGLGSVNGFGLGARAFHDGLASGGCAIGAMTLFPVAGFRSDRAAVAPAEAAAAFVEGDAAARLTRSDRFALEAAHEAWTASGAGRAPLDPRRLGVLLGATTGGMLEGGRLVQERVADPAVKLPAWIWAGFPVQSATDLVAAHVGAEGPRTTVVTACSSGANAVGFALDWIREGRLDVAIAGGVDSHCPMTYAGFNALQSLDPGPCRPFDRRRAGLTLGEGAGVLVLESEERARRRGATILAEIAGFGVSADAHHMTQPEPTGAGAALAMRRALADAGLDASSIGYVNAHGTGTPQNDLAETRAIRAALGEQAERVAVSSTKSQVGHCLGAAGAVELVATVLAVRHGFVPPTVNLEEPDPECTLDYVPREARAARIEAALSNSYGFGGNDTSVVVRRHG